MSLYNGKTLRDIRNESAKEGREKYEARQRLEEEQKQREQETAEAQKPTPYQEARNKLEHASDLSRNLTTGDPSAMGHVKTALIELSDVLGYLLEKIGE